MNDKAIKSSLGGTPRPRHARTGFHVPSIFPMWLVTGQKQKRREAVLPRVCLGLLVPFCKLAPIVLNRSSRPLKC